MLMRKNVNNDVSKDSPIKIVSKNLIHENAWSLVPRGPPTWPP